MVITYIVLQVYRILCNPIFITNGGEEGGLNNRVNLSLILNHTASSFTSSAPSLITSAAGLFWFQSLLQSKVILLRRAVMVGVRPNIRTATVYRISGLQDNQLGG